MYHPNGVGAFQISSYFKDDGAVTYDDLMAFAEVDEPEKTDLPFLNGIFKKVVEGGDTFKAPTRFACWPVIFK